VVPYSIFRPDDLPNDRPAGVARAVYFTNLMGFLVTALFIGGHAVIGKVEGGRYFVKAIRYGRLTEVSRDVYVYSMVHFAVTVALTLALFAFENVRRKVVRRSSAGGLKPPVPPHT